MRHTGVQWKEKTPKRSNADMSEYTTGRNKSKDIEEWKKHHDVSGEIQAMQTNRTL